MIHVPDAPVASAGVGGGGTTTGGAPGENAGGAGPGSGDGAVAGNGGQTSSAGGATTGVVGSGGVPGTGGAATGGAANGGMGTAGASTSGGGGGGTLGTGAANTGGASVGGAGGAGASAGGAGMAGAGALGAGGRGGASGGGGAGGSASVCSASTCPDGCCAQERCITQRTKNTCGTGGAACKPCGGCQTCGPSGACAVDPASRWTIVCSSAELTTEPPSGGNNWDPGNGELGGHNPDPFCQFETTADVVDTGAATTTTVLDSFTATWNQTVTPPGATISGATLLSPTARWQLWVGDDDGCDPSGCYGTLACSVTAPMQSTWLLNGGFTLMNVANCVALNVKLVCQP